MYSSQIILLALQIIFNDVSGNHGQARTVCGSNEENITYRDPENADDTFAIYCPAASILWDFFDTAIMNNLDEDDDSIIGLAADVEPGRTQVEQQRAAMNLVLLDQEGNLVEIEGVAGENALRVIGDSEVDLLKVGKKRLYGYAVWKPDIIIDYLNSLPDNSILQYSDIGCHFNKNGIDRLNYYASLTDENKMVTFDYSEPPKEIMELNYQFQKFKEYEYTKGDLIKYFGLNFESDVINSAQIWSGTFFMKKCDFTFKILKSWREITKYINLIDDSKSKSINHEKFIENRHDQSVFSILCKLNKIKSISAYECDWAILDGQRTWNHAENNPILAKRDLKYGIFERFISRQRKNIKRKINYFKSLKKS